MEHVTVKTDTTMQRSRQLWSGKRSANVSDEDTSIIGTSALPEFGSCRLSLTCITAPRLDHTFGCLASQNHFSVEGNFPQVFYLLRWRKMKNRDHNEVCYLLVWFLAESFILYTQSSIWSRPIIKSCAHTKYEKNAGYILTIYLLFRDIIIQSIQRSGNTTLIVKTSAKIFT